MTLKLKLKNFLTNFKLSKAHWSLLATGFIQVALVSCNTYQIAHQQWIGIFIVGFFISFVWSFNVKKIAFGTWKDRFLYCLGAAIGSITGCWAAGLWYNFH